MKRQTTLLIILSFAIATVAQTITNGIPLYDQNDKPVSAHGANKQKK